MSVGREGQRSGFKSLEENFHIDIYLNYARISILYIKEKRSTNFFVKCGQQMSKFF